MSADSQQGKEGAELKLWRKVEILVVEAPQRLGSWAKNRPLKQESV